MSTKALISFVPTRDMTITFTPEDLPADNPFEPFEGGDLDGLQNVLKQRRPVHFKAGNAYTIYSHWDGYPEGVGAALYESFTTEEHIANLIAAGDCSVVMGHVIPYISRGEEFNPPNESADYPAWVGQTWCSYLYVWTAERGWEVASVPVVDDGERADLKFEDLGGVLARIADGSNEA